MDVCHFVGEAILRLRAPGRVPRFVFELTSRHGVRPMLLRPDQPVGQASREKNFLFNEPPDDNIGVQRPLVH